MGSLHQMAADKAEKDNHHRGDDVHKRAAKGWISAGVGCGVKHIALGWASNLCVPVNLETIEVWSWDPLIW